MWGFNLCGFGIGWLFVIFGWAVLLGVVIWVVLRMFPTGRGPHYPDSAENNTMASDD